MDRYTETFTTWNKVAAVYQHKFMHLDLYNETYDYFCKSINKVNANILDVGCGPGNITSYLLLQRSDFKITGIDIAPNMIELAQVNNPTATFQVMDSRLINELNTKFDGIICGFCLPYLSQQESAELIAASAALLNANGIIYLSFVDGDPAQSGFQTGSSGNRVYFNYHTKNELKNQLDLHTFQLIKEYNLNYEKRIDSDIHTILIARKREVKNVNIN